jgi:hypothetical protein
MNIDATKITLVEESTFFDKCQVGTYSESTDSYGALIKTWSYGS